MSTPCEKADDISEIKKDIKELLAFKNKALGIIIAVTTMFSILTFTVNIIAMKALK